VVRGLTVEDSVHVSAMHSSLWKCQYDSNRYAHPRDTAGRKPFERFGRRSCESLGDGTSGSITKLQPTVRRLRTVVRLCGALECRQLSPRFRAPETIKSLYRGLETVFRGSRGLFCRRDWLQQATRTLLTITSVYFCFDCRLLDRGSVDCWTNVPGRHRKKSRFGVPSYEPFCGYQTLRESIPKRG
jgi:hypothetical protein